MMTSDLFHGSDGRLRAVPVFVALGLGITLVAAILAAYGELEWRVLAGSLAFAVVLTALTVAMNRWGYPWMFRFISRPKRTGTHPEAGQPDIAESHGPPEHDDQVKTVVGGGIWIMRVRVQIAIGLVGPLAAAAVVAVFLGSPFLLLGAGLVIGLGTALTWLGMWTARRPHLEAQGFHW